MKVDARKAIALAKIKMSEGEIERLQKDLDEMVELFQKLLEDEEIEGFEPMYTPSEALNPSRPDKPGETLGESWLYLVPRKEEIEREGKKGVYVKSPRP
ncbi:aspartyl/glutamyl-tRNA amidotransferase subunit C [Ignicoccus pacificus DSM 13166]|uniref:Aspartyl/glutamyl-tRNA amidotransferase subunit C n=1 Tax=Ignicoccus pacificus DSM 13166 TaxID=940294 RepID=A0A977PJV5_9CREN|nr:aspartyl/glutamyl-tRNA amidotransferase subunit C [Ignicoccus pacificus DSM 13166]